MLRYRDAEIQGGDQKVLIEVVFSLAKIQAQDLHIVDLVSLHWRRWPSMDLDWQLNVDAFADALHVGAGRHCRHGHGHGHRPGSRRLSRGMQRNVCATIGLWEKRTTMIGAAGEPWVGRPVVRKK